MLDIALLQEPIPAADGPTSLQTGDERLEEISQLAMDGEYLLAADRCQKLLAQRIYDARIVGYFLFGVYMEQGTAAMLPIFQTVKQCLTDNLPAIGPPGKREILLDSALQWLFASMLKQLEHAERKHDAAWQSLIEVANIEAVRQMSAELTAISAAAAKLVKRPRAVQSISHMDQLLRQAHSAIEVSAESMRLSAMSQASGGAKAEKAKADGKPARFDTSDLKGAERGGKQKKREPVRSEDEDEADEDEDEDRDADSDESDEAEDSRPKRARAAAARDSEAEEGDDEQDEDGESAREESTELPELPREEQPSGGKTARAAIRAEDGQGRSITIEGSPALLDLVRRIKAFERLTQRGDLLKAAVVADSVLATLDAFDPRVFFPKLLLPFFSGLSEHAPELEAAMAERESLTFRSLKQLLQLDLDALMK